MPRKSYKPEEIVAKLRQVDVLASQGQSIAEAIRSLLIFAGTDLAVSQRLFDARPSCWPVIGITAVVTLTLNPALGLILGGVAELIRAAILRRVVTS